MSKDPKTGTGKKPKGSGRRLYTDENPKDTVGVEFSSAAAVRRTLAKASFKSKSHKRQSQIINLIHQRARAAYQNAKDPAVKKRLKGALDYAEERKEASKRKTKRMQKAKNESLTPAQTLQQLVLEEIEAVLDEDLRKWFKRKGAPGKKGGWVDCNAPKYKDGKKIGYKACGRQKGEKRSKYPACRPTAAACKSKGKGKKWGKKAAKKSKKKANESMNLDQIIFETTREFVFREIVQPHLTEAFLEDGTPVCVACLSEQLFEATCDCPHLVYEAEYQGRKVKLNKPMRGDVKKFKVYVKDPKTGNIKKVNFGHGGTSAKKKGEKTMKIRKSNPKARKSFRARHNCDNPGPKTKARYWSCKKW